MGLNTDASHRFESGAWTRTAPFSPSNRAAGTTYGRVGSQGRLVGGVIDEDFRNVGSPGHSSLSARATNDLLGTDLEL